MSGLEEKLGPGHQQIVLGLLIFAAGALWGIMLASGEEIDLKDLFISAVIMLSGAMITMLGISFGTDNEDDRTNDLQDAITELTGMLNTLQAKVTGGSESEDELSHVVQLGIFGLNIVEERLWTWWTTCCRFN